MVNQVPQPRDRALLRKMSRRMIVDLVQRSGPVSRAAIARSTNMAKPTVSAIVEELAAEGILRELGVGEASPSGGRRPVLYEFNQASHHVVGVHIGVGTTTAVLADARGSEVARTDVVTSREAPADVLASLCGAIDRMVDDRDLAKCDVTAIGVCVPALIDPLGGLLVFAPNLEWRNVNIVEGLREVNADATIYVHNVAQAVLAAEYMEGIGQRWPNAVLLYEDNGVGAAIMIDGSIFHGVRGFAGEIGHCKLPGGEEPCNCGAKGCLETRVSVTAMLRRVGHEPDQHSTLHQQLRTLARSDDPRVKRALREVGKDLGLAASWLVNLVNPDALVIGGGFLDAGESLLDGLIASVRDQGLPESTAALTVQRSVLGSAAPVRGATLLALQASRRSLQRVLGGYRAPSLPFAQ
jgi:predicted NBD/HSP70 family sugar kinase